MNIKTKHLVLVIAVIIVVGTLVRGMLDLMNHSNESNRTENTVLEVQDKIEPEDQIVLSGKYFDTEVFIINDEHASIVSSATLNMSGVKGTISLNDTVIRAELFMNGNLIASSAGSSIQNHSIIFTNIKEILLPKNEVYVRLHTYVSGKESKSSIIQGLIIDSLVLSHNGWKMKKDHLIYKEAEENVSISILPAILTPSKPSGFDVNKDSAEFKVHIETGNNRGKNGESLTTQLKKLVFNVQGMKNTGIITIFNSNNESIGNSKVEKSGLITVTIEDNSISNGQKYRIETTAQAHYSIIRMSYSVEDEEVYTGREYPLDLGIYFNLL